MSFTATVMLAAIANGADTEQVADLYKEINKNNEGNLGQYKDPTIQEWADDNKGVLVWVGVEGSNNQRVGVVRGANYSRCAHYGGDRFPIKVDVEDGDRFNPFEYDETWVRPLKVDRETLDIIYELDTFKKRKEKFPDYFDRFEEALEEPC
jgi:hypothetical protein